LPDEVLVECHPTGISPELLAKLAALPGERMERPVEIELGGIPRLAGKNQLIDFSGRDVGRIVLIENIAPQRAALRASMLLLSQFFLIAAVLGLLGIYLYLKYVERLVDLFRDRMLLAIESRKMAHAKLLEEMLPFRKAFDNAADAIAILDLNRRLQFVNPAFRRLFGHSLEELELRGGVKTLYADPKVAARIFLQVSQGRLFFDEVEMQTKDKRVVTVQLRSNPIVNEKGEMIGILGMFTDLSERRSVERELRMKMSELAKRLHSSNDSGDNGEKTDEKAASGSNAH
jgi:PAS domain S-box-containing protein